MKDEPLTDEHLDNIFKTLLRRESFEKLTDKELSAQVLQQIWAKKVGWCSNEEFLLDEYITRFERMAGIKRHDETGEVL